MEGNGQDHELDIDLDTSTLSGDLRAAVLNQIQQMSMVWAVMPEGEQVQLAHDIDGMCRHLVMKAVQLIAADGRRTIRGKLESAARKSGKNPAIEGKLVLLPDDELRHEFFDAVGLSVLVVVADVEEYMGERAPFRPEPDQPSLDGV